MPDAFSFVTEDASSEPAGLLLQILNRLTDPIFVKDDQLRFIFVNDALCALLGKKREELLGRTLPEIACDAWTGMLWEKEKNILKTGIPGIEEWGIVDAEGRPRIAAARTARITDKAGKDYVFGALRPAAAASLPESGTPGRKPRGTVSREDVHALNNSLNIIRGYSELLLDDMPAGDPMRKDLEAIFQAARAAADLAAQF